MYKELYFIILFIILSCHSKEVQAAENECSDYYRYIDKAEYNLCNNRLAEAISYYDVAFQKKNNAVDLFNASCCALYLQDHQKAYGYLSVYFKKGARYYPNDSSFRNHFPGISRGVYDTILSMRDAIKRTPSRITMILDSLFAIDQLYLKNRISGTGIDSAWYYNRTNHSFVMNYIKEQGFNFETDSFIAYGQDLATPKYDILFHNFFQASLMSAEDIELLKEKVCEGSISPTIFANWWDVHANTDETGNGSIWMYFPQSKDTSLVEYYLSYRREGELFFAYDSYNRERREAIDLKRKEFNLEPYEIMEDKVIFAVTKDPVYLLARPRIQLDYDRR